MRLRKRILALLLALVMVIPMCLITVSADEAADYSLYHESFNDLQFESNGTLSYNSQKNKLASLFASGEMKVIPVGYKSKAYMYISHNGTFKYDGVQLQNGKIGDWMALKFVSPGEGFFSIDLSYYYHNSNNGGVLSVYLLPGGTANENIDSLLIDSNKLGKISMDSSGRATCTTGVELKANREYLLIFQVAQDLYEADENRVDMMFKSLHFGKGFAPIEGAFEQVDYEVVAEEFVKSASFYRATMGVNPANGHDLVYLMLKGSTMYVYDIDDKKIIDVEKGTHNSPFNQVFDEDGCMWMSGQGAYIYKYDPTTLTGEKFSFAYDLFGGKKTNTEGIAIGDDGCIYFTYWGWIGKFNPKTEKFENYSITQLNTDPTKGSDAQFSGHAGMIHRDGYLYMSIFGDLNNDQVKTSQVIKYDIAKREIVDYVNIWDATVNESYGLSYFSLVGDLLIGCSGGEDVPVFIDISGEKMERLDTLPGLPNCFIARVSDPIDGKVYIAGFTDNKSSDRCIFSIDVETRQVTRESQILYLGPLMARGATATVEGDPNLPGVSVVTPVNNSSTGMMDLVFYNPTTKETVIWSGISEGYGSGNLINTLGSDPTGRYIYGGCYGTNQLGWYDVLTGEVVNKPTYSHQIDGLLWYQDFMWVGNYSTGTITRFDPDTYEAVPLFELMNTAFRQKRMFAMASGDNKVFCAPVPDTSRQGAALVWYDIAENLTYVATGPNPEDVYYAQTTASFEVWRNAVTHQIETFDDDGDTLPDPDILIDDLGDDDPSNDIKIQKFYGVIEKQCITDIFYKNGYIIGSTTCANGQAAAGSEESAKLFAYDVNEMKLVALYDVADAIDGLEAPGSDKITVIDFIKEDPYEPGKLWSVVCDTLISCSFDYETQQFVNVKEELSLDKGRAYKFGGWKGREVVFDGDYMYVSFHNFGTFMINTKDPTIRIQINKLSCNSMRRGIDGNLYYVSDQMSNLQQVNLNVFRIADVAQPLVIRSVQEVIDALPDVITKDDEEQVMIAYAMYNDLIETSKEAVVADKLMAAVAALEVDQVAEAERLINAIGVVTLDSLDAIQAARWYYDSLPAEVQAKVSNLAVLIEAEYAYLDLKAESQKPVVDKPITPTEPSDGQVAENPQKDNSTVVYIVIGAVVLIAAAVAVVLILKKKKKTEE